MKKERQQSTSAGILLFRQTSGVLEVLLAHPGGPFWAKKDIAAWSIPKGLVEVDEELLAAARREFKEEIGFEPQGPFLPLGSVRLKSGKLVHAWACAGKIEPETTISNTVQIEWPRGSGRILNFPEIDRCEWFDLPTARMKMNAVQAEFLDRLDDALVGSGESN